MVAAHETCHMWWFGAVGNNQASEPWLDESLATYCERLFYEKNYPEANDWWWSYRVTFYAPEGKVDIPLYDGGGFTPYTNATYRRGALFLEDLRARLGDEAFFAFLKDYYTQMNGKRSTRADFFRVLAKHNTTDISDLLAEYFSQQP
jgi:aminopeptidase N